MFILCNAFIQCIHAHPQWSFLHIFPILHQSAVLDTGHLKHLTLCKTQTITYYLFTFITTARFIGSSRPVHCTVMLNLC